MKIALLHYHLKPGGVTTVIRHQVQALKKECSLLVLSGAPPESPWPVPCKPLAGIGYQNGPTPITDPQKIAQEIHQAIRAQWEGGCDILHVHNPTLAKNRAFLDILKALQEKGITLFLQIHDFAEDGRPQAYFSDNYPCDCHYGVINSRDYRILLDAGLKRQGLHTLFNPVKPLEVDSAPSTDNEEILYPVRAIRRKNIGEAILLSLYFRESQTLSITLPPNSPADMAAYNGWKTFSKKNNMNTRFETGLADDFKKMVSRAQMLLTTSITEGFGYTFLEAWTAGKLVWGRDLSDITCDFACKGIRLDHLYQRLPVPIAWMDHRLFFNNWKNSILTNSKTFGLEFEEKIIDTAIEKIRDAGLIDFGLLDEFFQKQILQAVISEPQKKERLAEINPFLKAPIITNDARDRIKHNRQMIQDKFNADGYRENLLEIYRNVAQNTVKQHIDKHCLAASFFNPETFSLLKWRHYVE